jgi:glycosyltransferase involved in cell wall biosynthesis
MGQILKIPKIMLVGMVPPPVHGQSIATQALFAADLSPLEKIIVEIHSSKTLSSVGKFSLSKALGLFSLIGRTWFAWLRHRPQVLYYTAGSGAWVPFFRDFIFLAFCRPLFSKVLIHYHAGNLVDFLNRSRLLTHLGRFTYGRGAWTIRLGSFCPAPIYPGNLVFDVPNGIDAPTDLPPRPPSDSFRILFLGNLFEDKGVLDLMDAVQALAVKHPTPITLSLVGGWPDDATRIKVERKIAAFPNNVTCPTPAPAYGAEKWKALAEHDVLAFPTYYSAENLPLVLIEAIAAGLPVIASDWRGIRSLVEDRVTGLLVLPHDIPLLTDALESLAQDPALRASIQKSARSYYEQHLTAHHNLDALRNLMLNATTDHGPLTSVRMPVR